MTCLPNFRSGEQGLFKLLEKKKPTFGGAVGFLPRVKGSVWRIHIIHHF
jgi:hypothetical protein